jgi:hypothetical protein
MLAEFEKKERAILPTRARNLTATSTFVRYLFRNITKTAKEEPRSLEDVCLPNRW